MYTALARFLSRAEQDQAARYRQRRDAEQFVVRRGLLRVLLGDELGVSALDVPLRAAEGGRPEVVGSPIGFSVSHSWGRAVYAIRQSGSVGVDLEHLDAALPLEEMAPFVLTPSELTQLARLAGTGPGQGATWFYRYWTAKEAVAKATGLGLAATALETVVTFDEDGLITRASFRGEPLEGWGFDLGQPASGWLMALAVPSAR